MITTILWDVDNTLLSFQAAEKVAIRACFAALELGECTDEMLAQYSLINKKYWLQLERGELTKEEVLLGRFTEFFAAQQLPVERAKEFNDLYQVRLGDTCVFMDDAYQLIVKLKEAGYHQYAASNGTLIAQQRKLKNSGLDQLLDGAFISDEIGHEKPTIEFYNAVFAALPGIEKEQFLMVGDSLTSDIQGANNAGIKSCWYNPRHEENAADSRPDYEIDHLWKILDVLH